MTVHQRVSYNLIGGLWDAPQHSRLVDSIDPATGDVVGRFAAGGQAEAKAATAAARQAFDHTDWAQNARVRQSVLLDWAARLERDHENLSRLLTLENGKIIAQSRGEVTAAISEIRYYAGLARNIRGHVQEIAPGEFSTVLREPAGAAGIIVPWNGPVLLLIRSLAPALCAGCTAVVKPAPQTTLVTAEVLRHLTDIAAVPRGVINMVSEIGTEVGEHLVASPDVDVISFTGSTATGKKIMAAAAGTMKKLSMELGGKSCCLVFDDVDVAAIAPKLAAAATIISGQQCTAARRILVHVGRAAEMKSELSAALSAMVVGPGLDESSHMGPLIDHNARNVVEKKMQQAFDSADEVLLRGQSLGGRGGNTAYLTPGLIAHADSNAIFCQEEIFGPLIVIESFETEREAIAKANNTVFGLSASVWTNDGARALRVARALRDGTVWINDHNKLFAEAEMGGYRQSGIGRLHGVDALTDFTELKHIYQNVGMTI